MEAWTFSTTDLMFIFLSICMCHHRKLSLCVLSCCMLHYLSLSGWYTLVARFYRCVDRSYVSVWWTRLEWTRMQSFHVKIWRVWHRCEYSRDFSTDFWPKLLPHVSHLYLWVCNEEFRCVSLSSSGCRKLQNILYKYSYAYVVERNVVQLSSIFSR